MVGTALVAEPHGQFEYCAAPGTMLGQRRSALLALLGLGLVAVPAPAALQMGSLHGLPLLEPVFYHGVYRLAMADSALAKSYICARM